MKADRLKFLLIVPPERVDFYGYLGEIENADFYILYFVNKKEDSSFELPQFIKGQFYWSDYRSPFQLLNKIIPDGLIFFEIIDLRQISLIVASHASKIKSFYLEHGAAGDKETAIRRWNNSDFVKDKLPYLLKRFGNNFADIFRSKVFYYSVTKGFGSFRSYCKYFILPFQMLRATPNKVLSKNLFPERIPDHAILFNEINFEEFEAYTAISKNNISLPGVPFFDKYYHQNLDVKPHVVYIEHPYLEQNLLNWDPIHHEKLARSLCDFAKRHKKAIYIKLHPFSNRIIWDRYGFLNEYVHILQKGNFDKLYLEAELILGFSSTLITGLLCARKNIVLLGWHPEPTIFGVDFSKSGLCHVSYSCEELEPKFSYWVNHNLTIENEVSYSNFLHRFNYPFDGKATQRVIDTILGKTV